MIPFRKSNECVFCNIYIFLVWMILVSIFTIISKNNFEVWYLYFEAPHAYFPRHFCIMCILCTPRPICLSTYSPIVDQCIGWYIDRCRYVDRSTDTSVEGCTKYTWSKNYRCLLWTLTRVETSETDPHHMHTSVDSIKQFCLS